MPEVAALTDNLGPLIDGFFLTLRITVISFAGALVIGVLVAAARVGPLRVLRGVGTVYVEIFQNVPLLVWLIIVVFVLPDVGFLFSLERSAIGILMVYEAAYVAEAVRTGFNTIEPTQGEAARAMGMTLPQVLRHVAVPQALRRVVQPLGSLFIATTMNSSLAAAVGVIELTGAANRVNLRVAEPLLIFTGAGLAYMLIALVGGLASGVIERRVRIPS